MMRSYDVQAGKELREAASKGQAEQVADLLKNHFNIVDQSGVSGLTALHFACGYSNSSQNGHNPEGDYYRTICTLMGYGANPNIIGGKNRQSAIESASHHLFIQNLVKINQLIPIDREVLINLMNRNDAHLITARLNHRFKFAMKATGYYEKLKNIVNIAGHIEKQDDPYIIASLGCGGCEEFFAIKLFFDELNLKFRYIGFDIHKNAKEFANVYGKDFDNFEISSNDATKIEQVKKVLNPSSYVDICIMRHPDFSDNERAIPFNIMFKDIIPQITKPGATIVISFYLPKEYNAFARAQLMPEKSPYSMPAFEELQQTINPKYKENQLCVPDNLMFALHLNGHKPVNTIEKYYRSIQPINFNVK